MTKGAYISPAITDPAIKETLLSFADEIEAAGLTIADADPDASLKARGGRLWYNASSSNLFIFSDDTGNYQPVTAAGEDKMYHSLRIYYPIATTTALPSAPVIKLTWANLTQASANAQFKGGLTLNSNNAAVSGASGLGVWQEDPPSQFDGNTHKVAWSDLVFQRTGDEATTVVTGSTPRAHVIFTGLVTFTNLSTAGETTINGGNITTGVVNADLITTGNLNAARISGGTIAAGHISANSIDVGTIKSGNFEADSISAVASLIGGSTGGYTNQQYTQINASGFSGNTGDANAWSGFSSPLQLTGGSGSGAGSALTSSGTGSGAGAKVQLSAYIPTVYSGHSSGGINVAIVVGTSTSSNTSVASFGFGVGGSSSGPRTGGPCFLSGSIDAASLTGNQYAYIKVYGSNTPSGNTAYARYMYLQALMIKA